MSSSFNVSSATAAELLTFFNAHTGGNPVKKFADRKTAERRVSALLAQAPAKDVKAPKEPSKPKVQASAPATPATRSAAIAASWQDPATKVARSMRYAVTTNGETYKSLPAALVALGIPLTNAVIRARAQLRDTGTLTFEGHAFKLVA